jgi:hypothetical protein
VTFDQPSLWNGPAPSVPSQPMVRRTDPGTSRDAAECAALSAPKVRAQCLDALIRAGETGMTDHELGAAVGRLQTSAGVRRKELERAGLVVVVLGADGEPLRRRTPSGSTAMVWRAVR